MSQQTQPRPVTTPRVSIWAVASLVLGIAGLLYALLTGFGPVALLAVVAGHVSLRETAKPGRSGQGVGVAGLVLGYLAVAVVLVRIVAA